MVGILLYQAIETFPSMMSEIGEPVWLCGCPCPNSPWGITIKHKTIIVSRRLTEHIQRRKVKKEATLEPKFPVDYSDMHILYHIHSLAPRLPEKKRKGEFWYLTSHFLYFLKTHLTLPSIACTCTQYVVTYIKINHVHGIHMCVDQLYSTLR